MPRKVLGWCFVLAVLCAACGDDDHSEAGCQASATSALTVPTLGGCLHGPNTDAMEGAPHRLAVTGPGSCFSGGWKPGKLFFPAADMQGRKADWEPARSVGWSLQDTQGRNWVVGFGSAAMPDSLLSTGDEVTLRYSITSSAVRTLGYVALFSGDTLIALAADSISPDGVEVRAGAAECATGDCNDSIVKTVIAINGESKTIASGTSAKVGDLSIAIDYHTQTQGVECLDHPSERFLITAYRASGLSGLDAGSENDAGQ